MQLSVYTTCDRRRVLIYNEARDIQQEFDAPDEVLAAMDGELKAYFLGYLDGTTVVLDERVSDQDW